MFRRGPEGPEEARAAAWLLLRGAGPARWGEGSGDELYRLKAEALAALHALGVEGVTEQAGELPFPFVAGAGVRLLGAGGQPLGVVGALDYRAYGTTPAQAAYGAELLLPEPESGRPASTVRARRESERVDMSVALEPGVTAAQVRRALADALGNHALELTLIDVYPEQGAGPPERVAFRVVYEAQRGAPRQVWKELRDHLEATLGARVRG